MKVYYNESCSVCRFEINHYKKQNISKIEWIDITNNVSAEKDTLKNQKTLLRRLHVKKDNQIYEGARAFLLVWKSIPRYNFLYNFFRLPVVFHLFSFSYEIIAYFLYLKNRKQLIKKY